MTVAALFGVSTVTTTASTPLTADFPASVLVNDVAIVPVELSDNCVTGDFSASGFTVASAVNPASSGWTQAFLWKRCAGTEGGTTLSVAMSTGAINRIGVISVYRGCVTSGTPYEGLVSSNTTTGTTIVAPDLTTSGTDRLGILLSSHKDSSQTVTGATGWSQDWIYDNHTGSGRQAIGYSRTIASAGTVTGVTLNYGFSAAGTCIALALIPATAGSVGPGPFMLAREGGGMVSMGGGMRG